ncbi:ATP synthase F0 complex subunit E mitochondrial [Trinorchestia longiramus]|nr:ATP synthase F0 complex subunit E mitochondrial [Trinorchestia longiramus]KAF2355716.1 ATP synthase F0 complex subunit E mitochondrial [Trinorchestia longiramus]
MPVVLKPAVRVSPVIKTARWSALLLGVLYGSMHFKSLQKKENAFREEEARLAPIRQKQAEELKKIANREELLYLAKETGTKVPPGF